jgi:preprotein translocase subunit SecA
MSILSVEHLTKVYGTGPTATHALDDVSFEVEAGEFIAIVGSSGSGKSTLMHLMGGVDRPTSGTVRMNGEDIFARFDDICRQVADANVALWTSSDNPDDVFDLRLWFLQTTGHNLDISGDDADPAATITHAMLELLSRKLDELGEPLMRRLTSRVMIRVMDTRWRTYLQELTYLKSGIGLRSFGQRDPLVEYKQEAYAGFEMLVLRMYEDLIRTMLHLEIND